MGIKPQLYYPHAIVTPVSSFAATCECVLRDDVGMQACERRARTSSQSFPRAGRTSDAKAARQRPLLSTMIALINRNICGFITSR